MCCKNKIKTSAQSWVFVTNFEKLQCICFKLNYVPGNHRKSWSQRHPLTKSCYFVLVCMCWFVWAAGWRRDVTFCLTSLSHHLHSQHILLIILSCSTVQHITQNVTQLNSIYQVDEIHVVWGRNCRMEKLFKTSWETAKCLYFYLKNVKNGKIIA